VIGLLQLWKIPFDIMMFINAAVDDISLKIFRYLFLYLLTAVILGFLLGADNLLPNGTSAFIPENLLSSRSSNPSEDTFSTYQNSSAGFTMRYPSEWEILELDGDILFRPVDEGAGLILNLGPIDLPDIVSKEGLGRMLAYYKNLEIEKYSNDKTSDFRLLESNMTTIDGNPASELVYLEKSAVEPEKDLILIELVSVKDKWRYFIVISAFVEEYGRYEPALQKMIDSIKITDPMY
jgi:hypothetical protein